MKRLDREAHDALSETMDAGAARVGEFAAVPAPVRELRRDPRRDPVVMTLAVVSWLAGGACVVTVAGYFLLKLWSLF